MYNNYVPRQSVYARAFNAIFNIKLGEPVEKWRAIKELKATPGVAFADGITLDDIFNTLEVWKLIEIKDDLIICKNTIQDKKDKKDKKEIIRQTLEDTSWDGDYSDAIIPLCEKIRKLKILLDAEIGSNSRLSAKELELSLKLKKIKEILEQ